ncbi:recombination protein RecR [Candidatus Gottesmanbacteria bacterium RIFCSPLOWO2_01_FULL_43_11b]|uniref:Recombination protein RecR n=1 Tax=Candidatus Gottesmanbacteria bacterium RIFCSPLOWO2_01_FULL_43_11b TaxID=1798392 RepID=A0A1F6AGE7_9BACT|nr:MAG: recombination protein RecR [Candidatus Gottesmanbacteria bacterium RIFCSPLOWO2_01_FULL_43_11b]
MSLLPKALSKLIESFEKLPGIGPKTAQRLAFYLLHVPQEDLDDFSKSLINLKSNTVLCSVCKNVSEADPCDICKNPTRDKKMICVVEQPTDVLSIERTRKYHGVYHVLHGAIDPLNNIGPDELYIDDLLKRTCSEIILATNPTMEGEATAMYINKQLTTNNKLKITRLAHGLPVGADIEYADEVTLTRALEGRREY